MKRKTCFLSKAVKWCASKCRALLGAFGFMLPAVTAAARRHSFRRLTLLLVFLFVLLAPMFFRTRPDPGGLFFACPVRIRSYCYATTFGPTDFTYTGTYTWVPEGGGNFSLRFLTSGTFTPTKAVRIDIFLAGGGGGGGSYGSRLGGGGAGGHAGTYLSINLSAGVAYTITIGGGGAVGAAGGATSITGPGISYSQNGGGGGGNSTSSAPGGSGGSGGGTGNNFNDGGVSRAGGTNGGNGAGLNGGTGQGTTTYEFGESNRALYCGAGGGAAWDYAPGEGGAGGGGRGAGKVSGTKVPAVGGTTNTGGGGGGRGDYAAAAGGSGIAIIRNAR